VINGYHPAQLILRERDQDVCRERQGQQFTGDREGNRAVTMVT
jgi:hypothetical protein